MLRLENSYHQQVCNRSYTSFDSNTTTVELLVGCPMSTGSMTMVYQALPFPLPYDGHTTHAPTATAFPRLIDSLQHDSRLQATGLRVSHILPDKTPPENIPSSPPVTPRELAKYANEDGYFSLKPVYNSVSPSVGLVVPPSDARMSLYERIIPPASREEVQSLFNPSTESAIVNRINELAVKGVFMLVLPTIQGAKTFHSHYLSPVLDPVLRNMISKYDLSTEIGPSISNMVAISELLPFNHMEQKIEKLLQNPDLRTPGMAQASFSIKKSSKVLVQVPRKIWEKWWIQQEQPRIDAYMVDYFGRGRNIPKDRNMTARRLGREILENVRKRGYGEGEDLGEGDGIEVAAFIIQRTE
jgi:hypothetical protein